MFRLANVFVPGGYPVHTYVSRSDLQLERRLADARDNLCKLVTVTGATKSGKTVLTRRIFSPNRSVWIDGGSIAQEDDFWSQILDQSNGWNEREKSESSENQEALEVSLDYEFDLFGDKIKIGTKKGQTKTRQKGHIKKLSLTPRAAALSQMKGRTIPLVIDDFHYMDRELQGSIVRALKPLIFEGYPVVILAIPHRRFDSLRVEREMTSRVECIEIPPWQLPELALIPDEGFPKLNIVVSAHVVELLAQEAYGSPHLMQEFCRELAKSHNVVETLQTELIIEEVPESLFKKVAINTGRVMFEKLAKGARQRKDRKQRKLRTGQSVDIYTLVLHGLTYLKPGLERIDYENLRAAIKDQLADPPPQAHEVSRVLETMAKIAANDEASTPVLDWDKEDRLIHITDPFFAYYLRWGIELQ